MIIHLHEVQRRPGSYAARAQGCQCPAIDNHYGKGYYGNGARNGWVQVLDCPLHKQGPEEVL